MSSSFAERFGTEIASTPSFTTFAFLGSTRSIQDQQKPFHFPFTSTENPKRSSPSVDPGSLAAIRRTSSWVATVLIIALQPQSNIGSKDVCAVNLLLSSLVSQKAQVWTSSMNREFQFIHILDDPKKVVGHFEWEIIYAATGQVTDNGEKDIHVREVTAEYLGAESKLSTFQFALSNGFTLIFTSGKDDRSGIGLCMGHEEEPVFSWDWFVVNGNMAMKLQESGQLALEFREDRVSRNHL